MIEFSAGSLTRLLLPSALAAGLALAGAVHAQTFPGKPVKLVVPFGPGGSSDVVARIVADGAGEALGQPVLIENVPGAGGNIGTARTAKAAPDGYTLVECTIGTCAINPSIYAQTGYDLQKDFVPVFLVGGVMNIFTVHPSTSIKSIADLVAYARANPGRLPAAIGAVGSSNHLTPVWFASIAGLDMLWVPFKGAGDAITALLGGQVLMFVDNEPSILPQVTSGKARPLAVTGPRRSGSGRRKRIRGARSAPIAASREAQPFCFLRSSSSRPPNLFECSRGPLTSAQASSVSLRTTLVGMSGEGWFAALALRSLRSQSISSAVTVSVRSIAVSRIF